jgi:hypothetical protein
MIAPEIDPAHLSEVGWGVVFEAGGDPSIREALAPLLALRREQSGDHFREVTYRTGETAARLLARHGLGPNQTDPAKMPYYLLIVGSPNRVPYRFQQQLDVGYAVGRLHFDEAAMYGRYAEAVIAAETKPAAQSRQITVFAPRFADDQHARLLADWLVEPLASEMLRESEWRTRIASHDDATKAALTHILAATEPPAILVTATHSVVAHRDDPSVLDGALVCYGWPGPAASVPLDPGVVFSAADVPAHLEVRGMIALLLGSFTAGRNDAGGHPEDPVGDRNAVSRLAQRLLGAGPGGALAVIGLVDRLLGFSFPGASATGLHRQAVIGTVRALTRGQRVGHASQAFDETYASAVTLLNETLELMRNGLQVDTLELSSLWTVTADLRNVVLLGDPAVRLPGAAIGTQPR